MRLKTSSDIKKIRGGGKLLAGIVRKVASAAEPGISAAELNALAEKLIKEVGGTPSFKGFHGYPAAACISINEELVHGIPRTDKKVRSGDIVSVDIGLKFKGLFTDMAVTVPVGKVDKKAKQLIKVTKQALGVAIHETKPNKTLGDVGYAIQHFIEAQGYGVVRSLVGHGVGFEVHEEPRVPNFGRQGEGELIVEGMVLAFEPMVTIGSHEVITEQDEWTIQTNDKSLSAHFEHTVAVTKKGCIILTKE